MAGEGRRPSNSVPIEYMAVRADGRSPILSEVRRVSIGEEEEEGEEEGRSLSLLLSLLFLLLLLLSGGLLGAQTTSSSNKEEKKPEAMMGIMRDWTNGNRTPAME